VKLPLTTTVRPKINETLGLKEARHPIRESIMLQKFVANDVYATPQTRFQILTGSNMSGKSTYIRMIALITIMAQIGSFVPATRAYLPVVEQLFARTSVDDSIEANVSTFAREMRDMSFILRNISGRRSIAIIDELGRATSTRDGLAIAIAIAEALIDSKSLVWFVTHFQQLAKILSERSGVVNLHMEVDSDPTSINMRYRIAGGIAPSGNHYGLEIARVFPIPADVLDVATDVATKLESKREKHAATSATIVRERRRKMLLGLQEHLRQARDGALDGEELRDWLKQLQQEFVIRMSAVEQEE
jgi:DNA mismatch repair protein MSH4